MTFRASMAAPVGQKQDLFQDIGATVESVAGGATEQAGNDEDQTNIEEPQVVDNIESLCMNCHEQGMTRLLLTRIPFFREVVIMSFDCPHCHFRSNEIQSAGVIQERGCTYTFKVESKLDLDRQLVKSETCTAKFVELDLEIPAQRGQLTNIEGLLSLVLEDLAGDQPVRKSLQPEAYEKIEEFIKKGREMLDGNSFPFSIKLDDPAGNSWVEPKPDDARNKWIRQDYVRTPEQNAALGLADTTGDQTREEEDEDAIRPDEVHTFPASCPSCARPCSTHMKLVEIPHFKEVVIMSTVCDDCGYKSNEVKTGGAVPSKGRIITLKVEDEDDLARDILKSETCALQCPELNLDLTPGTLGGRFTTLEGLLTQVYDDLHQRIWGDVHGESSDSLDKQTKDRWEEFFVGLEDAKSGRRKFTCILDDPLAASYVQNLYAPDPDPQLTIVDVERTKEQEDDLGISDMVTEGYEEKEAEKQKEREAKT
ncbi:ZPR1 zinc-finger domain-domain-containing protein [Tuber borchii]|uniref:ZPR1 zinc-finger domain-domain-containing protein n=1 Tax=Tuber borchii TaxID=42251 RepID=A0A2T6ZGS4_TUBBO|nr:ZPR1 zinc-finger domain-domain-containing protein [Tuber borchii]